MAGLLSKALRGLGAGLVAKAEIDWQRIKQEAETASRQRLMEIEQEYRLGAMREGEQLAGERAREEREFRRQEGESERAFQARMARENRAFQSQSLTDRLAAERAQALDPELRAAALEDAQRKAEATARGTAEGTVAGYGGMENLLAAKGRGTSGSAKTLADQIKTIKTTDASGYTVTKYMLPDARVVDEAGLARWAATQGEVDLPDEAYAELFGGAAPGGPTGSGAGLTERQKAMSFGPTTTPAAVRQQQLSALDQQIEQQRRQQMPSYSVTGGY